MSARPPRLAEWLMERSLAAGDRDAVLGDLAEEHADLWSREGGRAAARWYWRQASRSFGPNLARRSRPAPAAVPRPRHGGLMDTLVQDLRYCVRMLRRRPSLTAIALASLTIGIALPAVVFALLDTVVLKPLAISDPDRVCIILEVRETSRNHNFSVPDFADYRAAQRSFTDIAGFSRASVYLRDGSGSRMVDAELVSGGYFRTFGVSLYGGRGLTDADDRADAPPAVVVSEALWRDLAGSVPFDPRTLVLNGRDFAVVGVVSRGFTGMEVGRRARVWAPLHAQPLLDPAGGAPLATRRTASWLTLAARLRPGVTREAAAADLTRIDAGLAPTLGRPPRTFTVEPGRQGDSILPEMTGGPLRILFGAAVLVLLVACVNVANLLLARASEREREIAVRAALGAGRARLVRLVTLEAAVLSAAGAAAALAIAQPAAAAAARFIARFGEPAALDVQLDWRTAAFVAVTAVATTMFTGIGPALALFGRRGPAALADGGRGTSAGPQRARTRRVLVVSQFALSLALVVAGVLLAVTVRNLRAVPTGFDLDRVALVAVDPSAAQFDAARTRAYIDRALDRLSRVPGVRAAAFGRVIPLGFGGSRTTIAVGGHAPGPGEDMEINFNVISPAFFDATGMRLAEGRPFTTADADGSEPVAIVNQTMAGRYWPNASAIGQRFSVGDDAPPLRVVGVAGDVKYRALREERGPSFYVPLAQAGARGGVLHVRTDLAPGALLETLRRAVLEADPAVPVTAARTLRDQADLNLNDERLAMLIGVTLAGTALLLAAVGLYGSLAYMVGQRTRELGVRMALGATGRDVARLVLRQGLALCAAGTALGAAAAALLTRTLESRLFGVHAGDPRVFLGAVAVLGAVALLASWVPARRAAGVDPVTALRAE